MEKNPLDSWRIDWIKDFYVDKDMSNIEGIEMIREFYRLARDDPVYLIKAYTAETDYYRLLNQHLAITDPTPMSRSVDEEGGRWYRLRDLVGIIASHDNMKSFIFRGRVFRGMRLTLEELSAYELPIKTKSQATYQSGGDNIRYIVNKTFLSTSKDYDTAKSFAFGGVERHARSGELVKIPTICIYHIQSDARIALDVESISEYSHEREVLILPGQTFEVVSVKKNIPTADGLMNEIHLEEHVKSKMNQDLYEDLREYS